MKKDEKAWHLAAGAVPPGGRPCHPGVTSQVALPLHSLRHLDASKSQLAVSCRFTRQTDKLRSLGTACALGRRQPRERDGLASRL